MAGWCLEGERQEQLGVPSSRTGRQSVFLAEQGFCGAVGQRGHLRMGQWMLHGVTSSPRVPSSTSSMDPAAVPGLRMGGTGRAGNI